MARLRAILFDLDGTLVQTRESSWILFERVNEKFRLGIDTRERYYDLFKENMFESLPQAIGDQKVADAALAYFLELLRHEYRPLLVPGMVDVVRMLAADCALAIISSNATAAISRIVADAGIENCIAHVFGGDVVPDKRTAIRAFLADPSYATLRGGEASYREERPVLLTPLEVALVTDTVGDIRQGRECGVRTVAVTWGLHDREALERAGPDVVVHWPLEIVAYAQDPEARIAGSGLPEVLAPEENGTLGVPARA